MSGYSQPLEIAAQISDPDKSSDPMGRLVINFTCSNLKTQAPCQDVHKRDLVLNTTSPVQYFPS